MEKLENASPATRHNLSLSTPRSEHVLTTLSGRSRTTPMTDHEGCLLVGLHVLQAGAIYKFVK